MIPGRRHVAVSLGAAARGQRFDGVHGQDQTSDRRSARRRSARAASTISSTSVACASGSSTGVVQMYSCVAENRMDAALLERLLHVAEFREQAARHDLRFALLAGAVAHLVEAVIDEIQLEIVVIDAFRVQAEHAHLAELERHAAGRAEIAAGLGEDRAHLRDGARRVVGRGFDDDRDAVRRVTFVDDLFVGSRVLAERALDRGLDLVLRHVDVARVLHRAAQRRVGAGVGAAGLDGHVDVLGDRARTAWPCGPSARTSCACVLRICVP